jgi:hypothetical protein
MSGSSSKDPKEPAAKHNGPLSADLLLNLLDEQDEDMRKLFAKALNLYVSPGANATSDKEKEDSLRQAIEKSLQ